MLDLLKSEKRGHANHGWLDSRFSFSFSDYYDPNRMGFRNLLVINEDWIAPSKGFGTHPHRDMEIITYLLEGAIEHKDSMGTVGIIRPGEIQKMSAGTGVQHSEYNPSSTEKTHLLQIWILPDATGLTPRYEQKALSQTERENKLSLIAGINPGQDAVEVHQDIHLYSSLLEAGRTIEYPLAEGRYGWLQVAKGALNLNGIDLEAGDGVAISQETSLTMLGVAPLSEILLFDLN